MVNVGKSIPVTGSFNITDPKDVNTVPIGDGNSTKPKLADANTDEITDSPKSAPTTNISPLENVLKNDTVATIAPKVGRDKVSRFGKFKKPILYLVFTLLLVSVVIFSLTLVRTLRNRGAKVDLSDKSGEITWWGFEDPKVYEEVIELYQKSNPEAKVTYTQLPEKQYVRRLNNAFEKGEGPDIYSFHNSWSKSYQSKLTTLPNEIFQLEEYKKLYYPVIVSDIANDQGLLGIPLEYDGLTLFLNEDIFLASGKDEPTRWDELKPLATELTQVNSTGQIIQSGIAMGNTENMDYWQETVGLLLFQNNVDPVKPVGPEAQVVFDYFNSFASARVWDGSLPDSTIAFSQGDVAMLFGTGRSARQISSLNPSLKYKAVELPQIRKDDRLSEDVGYASYWAEGVWVGSGEKGLAFDFLKFVSDPTNLQIISAKSLEIYGIQKIYPRTDMNELQVDNPVLGPIISLAPFSKSWYLVDKTYDEPDGINAQVSELYKKFLENSASLGLIDQIAIDLVNSLNQVVNFLTVPSNK